MMNAAAGDGTKIDMATRVLTAIGSDPTQAFILLDAAAVPRWASPSLTDLFEVDFTAPNPLTAAMHADDVGLVEEIFELEQAGRADETFDLDRRFELIVRLRSPKGGWRWVAMRLHNRLDDPMVQGMVLQLTLANQERSTVEAFDAASLGAPTEHVLELVLDTLVSGGSGDTQAAMFGLDGGCLAATPGAGPAAAAGREGEGWRRFSDGRIDVDVPVAGPDGEVHGSLVTVSNFPDVRPFTRGLAEAVARRAALVLGNARDREELTRRAAIEPLSGLHHRGHLYDYLERTDLPPCMAVAFVDLDEFKGINDRFGHHVGDAVIVAIAERLRGLARPDDVVARVGGDEFVIVRTAADHTACRLDRDAIAAAVSGAIDVAEARLCVSASIGLANGLSASGADLVIEADSAMYCDKTSRRS